MGKAKNLRSRVASYFQKSSDLGPKTLALVEKIRQIEVTIVNSEIESLLLEANLIKKYRPIYNIRLTDGKAYPMIQITAQQDFPSVLISRKSDDSKSLYFGPFPNTGDMKLVLKMARRIFPFVSVKNHPKKYCLYWHLGLCPCPQVGSSKESKREYRKTIRHLIDFLDGKIEMVVKDLQKEQKKYIDTEEFEKAETIQKQISAINLITSPVANPVEYISNPNFSEDLRKKELGELSSMLKTAQLNRIECYDVSNTQGTNATGSMIVFTNGEKDTSQYRRFKIRFAKQGPNDFAMMKEVLARRFKHDEWEKPNLIIIDGGKGQVSAASSILNELKLNIPHIGLAKRLETIVIPAPPVTPSLQGETLEARVRFTEVRLSHHSSSLKLLQRVRDEAHRFAITYHKKLRSKILFS